MQFDETTIVIEPINFERAGLYEPPSARYEEFAQELARYALVKVSIVEALLAAGMSGSSNECCRVRTGVTSLKPVAQ